MRGKKARQIRKFLSLNLKDDKLRELEKIQVGEKEGQVLRILPNNETEVVKRMLPIYTEYHVKSDIPVYRKIKRDYTNRTLKGTIN